MHIRVRPTYLMMTAPMVRLRPLAGNLLLAAVILSTAVCRSAAEGLLNSGMTPKYNISTIPNGESGAENVNLGQSLNRSVCKSMDIRNNISSFHALENCTVVEGFVQILLLDNVTEAEFENVSFPRLTEITDYLMLYRVGALRSVGQLFPNLAVIRGQNKLFEYSLIIYEMKELQDIGLYNLREISSGQVRIDKNPSLCFVNTIEWSSIVVDHTGDNFLQNLKSAEECPLCPSVADMAHASNEGAPPVKPCDRGHCWSLEHCQLECPIACRNRTCDSKGNCCEENCIGCLDDEPHKCLVCRHVTAILGNGCMDKCPDDAYLYLNRRCVTKEECVAMANPLQFANPSAKAKPQEKFHKVLSVTDKHGYTERSCVLECPTNYMETNNECIQCEAGRCLKECRGGTIDSLASAQQLRGCTHINGSLEIQIRGGKNIVSKLDESLSMIEVIDGYLKIVRSFPLISLNFLKKLRHIRGNELENKKFVIFVLDNQNLQELWDWTNRTLQIDRGKLFFHFNPRLCLDKIRTLQLKTNLPNYTELDVAPSSNGDKVACHITDLNVTANSINSKYIILSWEQFQMKDHRKLLYYTVYSIEASHRNITIYDGRDACGGEGWRVDDAPPVDGNVTFLLSQLKPYTQYAIYVKTYTIASEDTGAQSAIKYFRTAPGKPSKPQSIKIDATTSSLHISWKPPASPNGIIAYYNVTITVEMAPEEVNINFCSAKPPTRIPTAATSSPRMSIMENNTCVCTAERTKTVGFLNATSAENQIDFEDKLYDYVYVKRGPAMDHIRRARRSFMLESLSYVDNAIHKDTMLESLEIDVYNRTLKMQQNVTDTEIFFDNLVHFKQYMIYIQACREPYLTKPGDIYHDEGDMCSEEAIEEKRTLMREGIDMIERLEITNITSDSAIVTWEDPVDPNGSIEGYHIIYRLVDDNDSTKSQNDCVSKNKTITSHRLSRLRAGNWSVQILVTTQAGTAHTTRVFYFSVKQPPNVVAYVLGILGAIAGIILLVVYRYRFKLFHKDDMKLITSINPDYIPTPYVPDDWEVSRESIRLGDDLGQGSFGMVYEGIARDIRGMAQVRCAVKTVNEHATNRERIEFLNEASVMKAFDTTHVVRLLGVVSRGQPTLVIMELMANGDLKTYLRSHRPGSEAEANDGIARRPPDLPQILRMAIEIADGMAYLSAKKFVHRDVAARNCMVSENLVVKIGDFGMTRDIYETDYYRKGSKGLLPVRWMAPESLKDGVFTSASDVWSYGVVLWEMATLASQPYPGFTNDQVLRYVIDENIMERPDQCPDILYDLMKRCWRYKPGDRPTFMRLCEYLMKDARPGFDAVSFYHSPAGIEARSQRLFGYGDGYDLDDVTTPLRATEQIDDEPDHDPVVATPAVDNTVLDFITYPPMTNAANGYVTHRPLNGTNA